MLFFIWNVVFSQDNSITFQINPDQYVASELFNRKIVMLADFGHHSVTSHHSIISVLNEWLNIAKSKKSNSNLTLILEYSSNDVILLTQFIETNDPMVLVEPNVMIENLEDLEFYYSLAKFSKKIDSINNVNLSKIKFDLRGFEEIGKKPPEWFYSLSRKEMELYFVNDRDSITSRGIISYLDSVPSTMALIFYGGAHLINKNVEKRTSVLTKEESKGYYLSHYLKEHFGNDDVLTVNQIYNPAESFPGSFLNTVNDEIFVKSCDIPWKSLNPDYYDSFILRKNINTFHPHPLKNIYCRFMIDIWLDFLEQKNENDSSFVSNFLNSDFSTVYFGRKYKNLLKLKSSYSNIHEVNCEDSLRSSNYAINISEYFYKDSLNFNRRVFLHKLGFILSDLNPQSTFNSLIWWDTIWPKSFRHILFFNSLGTYWIGYPDEKAKARAYLYQFSGQIFDDPIQYFQWYRKEYYGFDY
jgi:hypothetical protein